MLHCCVHLAMVGQVAVLCWVDWEPLALREWEMDRGWCEGRARESSQDLHRLQAEGAGVGSPPPPRPHHLMQNTTEEERSDFNVSWLTD